MTKTRKKVLIAFTVLISVILCCIIAYFVYGNTMININSEESINKHLAADANNPINIIATKKYEDYFAVLYTDPIDVDEDDDYAHYAVLAKHSLYKNRYRCVGRNWGNFGDAGCDQLNSMESDHAVCFIYDIPRNNSKCLVFEEDMSLQSIRKLDEFEVEQNGYIIIKEYDLLSKYHTITTYGDLLEIDYDNFYNENWEQTDKEMMDSMLQEQAKIDAEQK